MPRRPVDLTKCSPAMQRAVRTLQQEGYHPEVLTLHQVKVGDLNFYPARGTIYRDGDTSSLDATGLEAFIDLACVEQVDPFELCLRSERGQRRNR